MADPDEPVRTRLARLSAALHVDPPADDLLDRVETRIMTLPVPTPRPTLRRLPRGSPTTFAGIGEP